MTQNTLNRELQGGDVWEIGGILDIVDDGEIQANGVPINLGSKEIRMASVSNAGDSHTYTETVWETMTGIAFTTNSTNTLRYNIDLNFTIQNLALQDMFFETRILVDGTPVFTAPAVGVLFQEGQEVVSYLIQEDLDSGQVVTAETTIGLDADSGYINPVLRYIAVEV